MMVSVKLKRTAFGLAASVIAISSVFFIYEFERSRLSTSILNKIDRLALEHPDDIPELEWAALVYWTHNLHCNSLPQQYGSFSKLRDINHYLEASLEAGPKRETIETIWEKYSVLNKFGMSYSVKYKPQRDSIIEAIATQRSDYFDVGSYQDFLDSVRQKSK